MLRIGKILLFVFAGLLALLLMGAGGAYMASQQTPSFYEESLAMDPQQQTQKSDELLSQATALSSQAKREGGWQATFTEEQINGWLAVDWVRNHRESVPAEVQDPRIQLKDQQATLAWRHETPNFSSVVSVTVDITLPKPNQLAIRFRSARAGALPLPMKRFLDRISQAAQEAELSLRWVQKDGDPVAIVELPTTEQEDFHYVIDQLELRQDELFFAGRTISQK